MIDKNLIKLGLTLMIITLIATLALSLTNEVTKKKIEAQLDAQLKNSLARVIPEADDFKEEDNYFEAYKNNELIGKVLRIEAQGYSSVIQLIVGVDLENKITGVVVLNQLETPGLGANIEKNEFLDQFVGKISDEILLTKDNGKIDGVTGATISSRAVTEVIRANLEDVKSKKTVIDEPTEGDTSNMSKAEAYIASLNLSGILENEIK